MLLKKYNEVIFSLPKIFLIYLLLFFFLSADFLSNNFYKKKVLLNKFFVIRLDKNQSNQFTLLKKDNLYLKTITEYTDDKEYLLILKTLKKGSTIIRIRGKQEFYSYYIEIIEQDNLPFKLKEELEQKYTYLIDLYQQGKVLYEKRELLQSLEKLILYYKEYKNLIALQSSYINDNFFADAIFTIAEIYFHSEQLFNSQQAYYFYSQYEQLFPDYPQISLAKKKKIYLKKNFLL